MKRLLLAVLLLLPTNTLAQDVAPGRTVLRSEEIDTVASKRLGKVKRCYRAAVKRAPSTYGTIGVGMNISAKGVVAERWIAVSTVGDPLLEKCVLEAFEGLTFTAPGGYGAVARFGMLFRTEGSPAAMLDKQQEAWKRALRGADPVSAPPPPPFKEPEDTYNFVPKQN